MIEFKQLTEESDFKALSKGDIVVCEWHRDSYKGKNRTRFATYDVVDNTDLKEIILQKQMNVYFNYEMFLSGESNLRSIAKLTAA
jgi:hypothetical protein